MHFLLGNPLGFENAFLWTASAGVIAYCLYRRSSWTVGLAFFITAISAIRLFANSLNGIPVDDVLRQLDMASESALISLVLTVFAVQCLSTKTWLSVFKWVAVVNAVAIIIGAFFHAPYGILLNASMSGCFSAVLFQILGPKDKVLKAIVVASIFCVARSLPIAVFFVGLGAQLFLQRRYKTISLAVVASFVAGFLVKGELLFDPRGRTFIWLQAFDYFDEQLSYWIGSGLGGFYVVGPTLNKNTDTIFTWLHSDWLQTAFEQGIVGFLAVALLYGHAVSRARKTPQLFASLIAYGAFAVANMPLRFPLSGLFGAVLIQWALGSDPA